MDSDEHKNDRLIRPRPLEERASDQHAQKGAVASHEAYATDKNKRSDGSSINLRDKSPAVYEKM